MVVPSDDHYIRNALFDVLRIQTVKYILVTFDLLEKVVHCANIYLLSSEAPFKLSVPCL